MPTATNPRRHRRPAPGAEPVARPPAFLLRRRSPAPLDRWSGSELLRSGLIGHALHPLLTDLPLGFWTAATALDLRARPEDRGGEPVARRRRAGGGPAPRPSPAVAEWARSATEAQRVGALHGASQRGGGQGSTSPRSSRARGGGTPSGWRRRSRRGPHRRVRLPRRPPDHRPQGRQPRPGLRRGMPWARRTPTPAPSDRCRPIDPVVGPGCAHVIDVVERAGLVHRGARRGPARGRGRGAAARLPPGLALLVRGDSHPAPRRPAHPGARPARLLARRPAPPTSRPTGSAPWRPTSWRSWMPLTSPPRTSSATTGVGPWRGTSVRTTPTGSTR